MNTDNGALSFDAYINNTDFKRQIDEMNARIKGLSSSTVKETKKMDDAFGGLGKTVMALGSTALLAGFARQIVTVTGEFQKLDIAFTTMLGSKERATALIAQIVDTAAKTPFTLQEVAQGAKQLLAYQVAAEKVNETVIRLGNISAGVGVPLGQLVAVYGQVKAKGKLQGDDMKQFMNAGIPIIEELAKVTGKADDQIQQLVTDGKIGFAEVQKVIENLTDKGGMFFNLMEEQSKTLSGQISNLQDAWDRMLNSIGQSNSGLISGVIGGATYTVEHYKEILDILTPLIVAFGAYKAAVIATAAAHKAAALMDNIRLMAMFRKELGLATAAQQAFNTASKANVVGLAIAAVAGLGMAIYNYIPAIKTATDLQEEFNGLLKNTESYDGKVKMIERYDELSSVQNKTNEEQDEYNSLIDALSKTYPDAIEKIDEHGRIIELNTGKLKEYNQEQKEALTLVASEQLRETEKAIEKIQSRLARARAETSPTKQQYLPGIENSPGEWVTVDRSGKERADAAKKVLDLNNELQKLKQLQDDLQIQLGIKVKVTTEEEGGKDGEKKLTVGEQIEKIKNEIKKAQVELSEMRDKNKSESTPKDIDDKEGEIKNLEKELELLTGIKASKKDNKGQEEFEKEKLEAKKKYGDAEIALMRSQIKDKKELIDFDLKQELAGIDEMEEAYKKKAKEAGIKNPDTSYFDAMRNVAEDQATQDKTAIDKQAYDDLLKDYRTFEQKKQAIIDEFEEKRKKAMGNEELINQLNEAQGKALSSLATDELTGSDMWASLFNNLDELTASEIDKLIQQIEAKFETLSVKFNPVDLAAIRTNLEKAKQVVIQDNPFKQMGEAIRQLMNESARDSGKTAGEIKKDWKSLAKATEGSFKFVQDAINSADFLKDAIGDVGATAIASLSTVASVSIAVAAAIKTAEKSSVILLIIQAALMVVQAVVNVIKSIVASHDKQLEKSIKSHKKNVEELKNAYEDLERAIDKALGGDQFNLQKSQIDNLKKQQQEYSAMIQAERDKKKTDSGKINEYQDQIKQANNAIEDILTSMREDILQTTVSDAAGELGNAIIDAFAAGENAAEAWGKKVDDIVGNVIRKMLIEKLVEQPVGQILNRYMSQWVDGSGNFLGFDAVMNTAMQMGQELSALGPGLSTVLDNLPDDIKKYLFGDSANNDATLTGQIKGVSEETASMLSGYINAIRINQIESLNITRSQLLALDQISANTSHLVQMREVVDQLKALNRVWSTRPQGL